MHHITAILLVLAAMAGGALLALEPTRLFALGLALGLFFALALVRVVFYAARETLLQAPHVAALFWRGLACASDTQHTRRTALALTVLLADQGNPERALVANDLRPAQTFDELAHAIDVLGDSILELERISSLRRPGMWSGLAELHENCERWREQAEAPGVTEAERAP
jgi:hypothetical protein